MAHMRVHLPDEIAEYEGDVQFFVDMMIRKLHMNRNKGFAEGLDFNTAIGLIEGELRELTLAVTRGEPQFAALAEAVDVANTALLAGLVLMRATKPEYQALKQMG